MIPKQEIEKIVEIKSQSKGAKATGSARTQARKARRELAKVAVQPVVPKVIGSKRPHAALLGARASAKLETEQARAYFDSLIVPESGSAQFPDLSDFPTIPVSSKYFISPTPIADSVSGQYFTVIAFFPSLNGAYCVPTGIASGVITWGALQSHPRYSSYLANFASYRTISMAVRAINSTNLNQKLGLFYQDLISERTGVSTTSTTGDLPTTLTTITSSPTVKAGAFSNEYLEDVPRQAWLPNKLNQLEFLPTDVLATSDFFVPEYPAILMFCDHSTSAIDYRQDILFEVFYNFEAVPLYQTAMLFNPTMCVGSPEPIAKGLLENRGTLMAGVNATVKDFQRTVGTIKEFARSTSELMSGLGSLASISGIRHGELMKRRSDSALNRLVGVLKDFIPDDIHKRQSDRKDVETFLECVKTLKGLVSSPDFPRCLMCEETKVKVAPWKQEVISIDVSDVYDDPDYQVLSARPSLKTLKKA